MMQRIADNAMMNVKLLMEKTYSRSKSAAVFGHKGSKSETMNRKTAGFDKLPGCY